MSRVTTRPLVAVAAATALGLAFVSASAAQAATAKTVTACVSKKTGTMKVQLGSKAKRKCPKGTSKVTWPVAPADGKNGANGKNGTNGVNGTNGTNGTNASQTRVLDANGALVGTSLGVLSSGLALYDVLFEGGSYFYYPSGQVAPLSSSPPVFKTNTCTGPAYAQGPAGWYAGLAGGVARVVFRTYLSGAGAFGPTKAWKHTASHESVTSASLWTLDPSTGACIAATGGAFTGELVLLAATNAPPDVPGPLSLG